MIFRTDKHEYLSANAVNSLTTSTVASVVGSREPLTNHSWRRMLPTIARHLNLIAADLQPKKGAMRHPSLRIMPREKKG